MYEGQFKDNRFHGYGTEYFLNGTHSSGYWEFGVKVDERFLVSPHEQIIPS